MKRTIKVFLVSAVFFVVLMLAGCGMPNILYLDTNDYTFDATKAGDTSVGISDLVVTSTEFDDVSCYGPSLMFFYTIANGDSDTNNTISQSFAANTAFLNEYFPSYSGRPLNSTDVVEFTAGESRQLYAFNKANGKKSILEYKHPTYVVTTNSIGKELKNLTLTYDELGKYFEIPSSYTGNYSLEGSKLYRYNGYPFLSSGFSSEDDYEKVTSGNTPYIYVYAAFCISPDGNDAGFNNIFWSQLIYLGSIKLT